MSQKGIASGGYLKKGAPLFRVDGLFNVPSRWPVVNWRTWNFVREFVTIVFTRNRQTESAEEKTTTPLKSPHSKFK